MSCVHNHYPFGKTVLPHLFLDNSRLKSSLFCWGLSCCITLAHDSSKFRCLLLKKKIDFPFLYLAHQKKKERGYQYCLYLLLICLPWKMFQHLLKGRNVPTIPPSAPRTWELHRACYSWSTSPLGQTKLQAICWVLDCFLTLTAAYQNAKLLQPWHF